MDDKDDEFRSSTFALQSDPKEKYYLFFALDLVDFLAVVFLTVFRALDFVALLVVLFALVAVFFAAVFRLLTAIINHLHKIKKHLTLIAKCSVIKLTAGRHGKSSM